MAVPKKNRLASAVYFLFPDASVKSNHMTIAAECFFETFAATTLMTVFSYAASASFRKLFVEPLLINYVVQRSKIKIKPTLTSFFGWIMHYIAGLLFIIPYHWLWNRDIAQTWLGALLLGAISGIVGVLVWMLLFRLPRKEPNVAFKEYYFQLWVAHVIFATSAFGTHSIIR